MLLLRLLSSLDVGHRSRPATWALVGSGRGGGREHASQIPVATPNRQLHGRGLSLQQLHPVQVRCVLTKNERRRSPSLFCCTFRDMQHFAQHSSPLDEPSQGRIQPVRLRGQAISVLFGTQVLCRFRYCKRDEAYFTALLWQNNGRQNSLKSQMLFSDLYKIMVKEVTFTGFRGGGAIDPLGSASSLAELSF